MESYLTKQVFCPKYQQTVLSLRTDRSYPPWMENSEQIAKLTEREKECLRRWLQHKSAKEIAADLSISHHAVEKRLKMARTKLGATSSLKAARMLSEAEGYGQTVGQTPDLPSNNFPVQTVMTRPFIFGVIAMILIGATLLALVLQPSVQTSEPEVPGHFARHDDEQLNLVLMTMIASAEVEANGEILLTYPLGDRRFMSQNSGYYWQISAAGQKDFASRSLWNRRLQVSGRKAWGEPLYYNSNQFENEPLRVVERTVHLANSDIEWHFIVARPQDEAE